MAGLGTKPKPPGYYPVQADAIHSGPDSGQSSQQCDGRILHIHVFPIDRGTHAFRPVTTFSQVYEEITLRLT